MSAKLSARELTKERRTAQALESATEKAMESDTVGNVIGGEVGTEVGDGMEFAPLPPKQQFLQNSAEQTFPAPSTISHVSHRHVKAK